MATKKNVVLPAETPSYGKKSDPPRRAVKEMAAKQSESSSKDELHGAKSKAKTKGSK